MNKMYLVLGDWSDDGHGKHEKVLVEVNKTVKEVQDAYKASCALTNIAFDSSTPIDTTNPNCRIAVDYEDSKLYPEVIEILKAHNCPLLEEMDELEDGEFYLGEEEFVQLWFWFVQLSAPDLEWNLINHIIPTINGFWDKNLNTQFGYGLYY